MRQWQHWIVPAVAWLVTLAAMYLLCSVLHGCTTITATRGDMTITRTSFGIALALPTFVVKEVVGEGCQRTFSLTMRGATSDGTQAIEAAVEGALKGAAMAVKP